MGSSMTIDSFPYFLNLPAEIRVYIYRFFFGDTDIFSRSCESEDRRDPNNRRRYIIDGNPTIKNQSSAKDIVSFLTANKQIFQEATPVLYSSAEWITSTSGVLQMLTATTQRLTRSTSDIRLCPEITIQPELLITTLTIHPPCITSGAERPTFDFVPEAVQLRDFRKSIALLENNFPRLKKLKIWVNRYKDIFGISTIPKIIAPICCLRRITDFQFIAQDLIDLHVERATCRQSGSNTRLRMEEAHLEALGAVLSGRYIGGEGKRLHGERKCIYRGPDGGQKFMENVLARVLKEEYRLKVRRLS